MTIDEAIETVEYARAFNKENTTLMRALDVLIGFAEYHQEAERNEPLTLKELLRMNEQPVFVVSAIGEQPMWYIVDVEENELKNPWDRLTLEDWDEGYPYTAYRRPPKEFY